MSNRNHKKASEKRRKERRYGLGKGCLGLLLLIAGIGMSLDTARLEEVPLWVTAGPDITVYQEGLSAADINVECLLRDGQIELKLFAGEQMEEEVNVWLSVTDLFFPYQWKTYGMDEMLVGHIETESYDVPENFPQEKVLTSVKSQRQEGETQIAWFLATLKPGKAGCRLHMEMDPESLQYEKKGNVNIRMPQISASRENQLYEMDSGDVKAFLESGDMDLRGVFASYMINGKELMMPKLHIASAYKWDDGKESYRQLASVRPEQTEITNGYINWQSEVQWLPAVTIHDASYEKGEIFQSLLGGILITVGSGMVITPAVRWLEQGKTPDQRPAVRQKRK